MQCLVDIKSGVLSRNKAAVQYSIPVSTLKNKMKLKHTGTVSRPPVFEPDEESCFVHHLIKLSDYGFPVDETIWTKKAALKGDLKIIYPAPILFADFSNVIHLSLTDLLQMWSKLGQK